MADWVILQLWCNAGHEWILYNVVSFWFFNRYIGTNRVGLSWMDFEHKRSWKYYLLEVLQNNLHNQNIIWIKKALLVIELHFCFTSLDLFLINRSFLLPSLLILSSHLKTHVGDVNGEFKLRLLVFEVVLEFLWRKENIKMHWHVKCYMLSNLDFHLKFMNVNLEGRCAHLIWPLLPDKHFTWVFHY